MHTTFLILSYRLRSFRRWVRAHGFEIFALGPIILGGALWVLDRQLTHLRLGVAESLRSDGLSPGAPGLALALLLSAAALPATLRELYGHRGASGYLDALPIPAPARFHVCIAVELARTLPALGVLLLATGALAGELLPEIGVFAQRAARLLAVLCTLSLLRFVAALVSVHYRLFAAGRWLVIGALLAIAVATPYPAPRLLLLPWLAPAAELETVFLGALGSIAGTVSGWNPARTWTETWALAATALALYLAARILYLRWHRRDLEVAARLAAIAGDRGARWSGRWPGSGARRPLAVQVTRDLLLVVRRFSPAVYSSAGLALVIDAAVLTSLLDSRLPELWRERIAVSGLTLSVLAVTALVPFLLKHELPRFWIEKSTGVDLEQIWKAKLWTAGLLATAPLAIGIAMLVATPGLSPTVKVLAVLKLAANAWIVASILGLAVFEIADQPLLGLVFGSLLALALAGLITFYPAAWWMWMVLALYVAWMIADRATRRVRLVEAGP